ncbi:MAG: hypothetical protein N2482_03720, partial [Patescibacteria group bacterium]|nr:hypothetical protein [Patescibacteria group bacterium]
MNNELVSRLSTELVIHCLENRPLDNNPLFRFCPGLFMKEAPINLKRKINGVYGLEMLDKKTDEAVAFCGFNIEGNNMIITHTPQGKRPNEFFSKQVRNRFGRSHFRERMIEQLIEIAKKLGVKEIQGLPAALFHEIDIGLITYEEAYKRMDA